jgi:hypothetical protein
MRRSLLGVAFEREARWLMIVGVVIPLLFALIAIFVPGLWRLWG